MFGERMRELRKEAGLSTKDVGELVGLSQSYVCNIECNNKKPSPQVASRIASIFGLKPSDMLDPTFNETWEERKEYGKKLLTGRLDKGYQRSLVAGALGIPVEIYAEYERGECSITPREKELLGKLLDLDKEVVVEEEPVVDDPIDICDIIPEHIKDLKVDSDTQKKVWRYFTFMKVSAEEHKLFG